MIQLHSTHVPEEMYLLKSKLFCERNSMELVCHENDNLEIEESIKASSLSSRGNTGKYWEIGGGKKKD